MSTETKTEIKTEQPKVKTEPKKHVTIKRKEIPMEESLASFINENCRQVPGALVPLKLFRAKVTSHARSKLERRFRWRREFKGMPTGVRVTRRTVCATCNALRPTEETCGDHYGKPRGTKKISFVCGLVLPDENATRIDCSGDSSSSEDGESEQPGPVLIVDDKPSK